MRNQKSRSRSKSHRNRSSGGGNGNVVNRVFDSSGPEGKVRGTPQQIIDKYNQLARDAQLSNDRVAVENFQQHAEHYTRMLADSLREAEVKREQQESQNRERQQQRDSERAERQERDAARGDRNDDRNANQGNANQSNANQNAGHQNADQNAGHQSEAKAVDPASAPQPDLPISEPVAEDSGLVDTPESKPARKPAPRKRTRKPKVNPLEQVETPDTPEAAE